MIKKILKFIIILIPWLLSTILIKDTSFFETINKPTITLPIFIIEYLYILSYFLITICIYKILDKNFLNDIKPFIKIILINFIFSQLYLVILLVFKNIFLSFVDSVIILLSSLFLYYEAKEIDADASKYLIFYLYFNLYISILNLVIYFMNF